ncbi:nicotinate-nucleotide adenylyltransferase [Haliovirga abyssi]|uniref:Probable nicotinate-nucleotide adenylyltransferase n=1 Tax=Haliovirga abyssi TaxID=2996794 RepID=A0AAU9D3V0_9FUSO|nr:nicotinate-nucleotide adenylyltransferase [Haliovirga abyssi]BDU50651.1 putative nicotinate-nucleotide adenylyltransferase [Haliovirga abyssi]
MKDLKKKKIGIYGGSFNPIHMGHLILAEWIKDRYDLDEIWFIPVGIPSHRENNLVNWELRYKMVKESIKDNPKFKVLDIEIKKDVTSYTIDTLVELKKRYPDYKFYEIIGEDSAEYLDKWKDIEKLLTMCKFIVVNRKGYNFKNIYGEKVKIISSPIIEISATEIREKIKNGKSIKYLVNENVLDIIKKEKIYK